MNWLKLALTAIVVLFLFCIPITAKAELYYIAKSYCGITEATGHGYDTTKKDAVAIAIGNCIINGGVPACCSNGIQVTILYAATAYCSATGFSGKGIADSQDDAIELAILRCVYNGGIKSCCRNGVRY